MEKVASLLSRLAAIACAFTVSIEPRRPMNEAWGFFRLESGTARGFEFAVFPLRFQFWLDDAQAEPEVRRFHEINTEARFFDAIAEGVRPFDIRQNDRPVAVGDWLRVHEIENLPEGTVPDAVIYTGRCLLVRVTYVTDFAQKPGFVVLGLEPRQPAIDVRSLRA